MNIIETLNQENISKLTTDNDVPDFAPGDTVRIHVKVVEGTRERVQVFEGVCIARKNRSVNSSFTVRKISHGEGVERSFIFVAGAENQRVSGKSAMTAHNAQCPRHSNKENRRLINPQNPSARPDGLGERNGV